MKSLPIFIMLCVCNIQTLFAQDTLQLYLNSEFESIEKEKAEIIRDVLINNGKYFISDHFTNGRMIMKGEFSSIDPWVEDGAFKYYDNSGKLYATGNFIGGNMSGRWIYLDNERIDTADYDSALERFKNITIGDFEKQMKKTNTEVSPDLLNFIQSNIHFPPRIKDLYPSSKIIVRIAYDYEKKLTPLIIISSHPDFDLETYRLLDKAPDSLLGGTTNRSGIKCYDVEVNFTSNEFLLTPKNASSALFKEVDQGAQFQGGDINKFREWVQKNVIYPVQAIENGEYGRVMVRIVVTNSGNVDQVEIVKSSGSIALDNESIRVVKKSPKWTPAQINNQAVNQYFVFPVIYMLR
jgi:TonB family protein